MPNYFISWNLNKKCNHKCVYCYSSNAEREKEYPIVGKHSPYYIYENFNKIGLNCSIHLAGGEPFLYPDFITLCKLLTKNHYIGMNSNLSTKNIITFADNIDPKKVLYIYASLHIVQKEKKLLFENFINNYLYLKKRNFNLRVDYVVYPPLFTRIKKDFITLKKYGINKINCLPFVGYYKNKKYPQNYTNEEKMFIKKNTLDKRQLLLLENKYNLFGYLCSAGTKFFNIKINGDIHRCNSSKISYGNLFEGKFHFDQFNKPCPFLKCSCLYEGINSVTNEKANIQQILLQIIKEWPLYFIQKVRLYKLNKFIQKRLSF